MSSIPRKAKMAGEYDKYVLVTGGAGFIGSHFLDYVVKKYPRYHFLCIDKIGYASGYSTHNLDGVMNGGNFEFAQLDMAEQCDELREMVVTRHTETRVSCVVNFAAESSVDRSFEDPRFFTVNNVLGTQNLLECFRELQEKGVEGLEFVHISTDEVYGEQAEGVAVDETGTLNPTNPYAATKAAIDLIIQSYRYSYNLPVTIIRSNNVYGPRQYPEKIVAHTFASLMENRPVHIHGDGRHRRVYLHVSDLSTAIDTIWHHDRSKGQTYNVGGNEEIDNLSMVSLICRLFYDDDTVDLNQHITFVKDRNYNDNRYSINFQKVTDLGWHPRVNLYDGIKMLVEYIKRQSSV